ncbi:MAG TPA: DinB family protein [Chloroflexota bacterium]|nr:DinB family protein [Chloroflexota bacterium]HUM67305.1 DinB family protein [Chloroflexota bacterium]
MNVYHVQGIRHRAVVFAGTSDEAVAQALASGEVGEWEAPEAQEIPLPAGYALRPERQSGQWLAFALEEAWTFLCRRLEGLTDAEMFWQPVPNCWTVHQDGNGRWVIDYALPEPDPSPFTTIAWRLVHVAACKIMYHEYAFGLGKLTWDGLDIPHTTGDAIAWLETGQAQLKTALDGLNDADLAGMRPTNWGDVWPTWRIFWTMAAHDLQHGGEIGCLRDLYQIRHS